MTTQEAIDIVRDDRRAGNISDEQARNAIEKIKGAKMEIEHVDIIASGYEWICPECNHLNKEIEYNEKVGCSECMETFIADFPEHAMG